MDESSKTREKDGKTYPMQFRGRPSLLNTEMAFPGFGARFLAESLDRFLREHEVTKGWNGNDEICGMRDNGNDHVTKSSRSCRENDTRTNRIFLLF